MLEPPGCLGGFLARLALVNVGQIDAALRGLVHGMGFAGALKELGVGSDGSGVFRPLFFFSLGLEATQLGLAVMIFPLLLWLRTMPTFPRLWMPACSGLIALAGIFWFVQRVFFGS